jgi:NodT family efflux transporter outer membrane factor (OMF) lipoprotein
LGEALRANPALRAAAARARGAGSARTEAALNLAPIVTFSAGYNRQRLASAGFPLGVGALPDQNLWDGGLVASWELDVFGRLRRNLQARGALAELAREDLRDAQVSVVAGLARAYFQLRGSQEQLAVALRNAENQRRTLKLTRDRLDAGRGTAFDVERAQAQLDLTLASIPAVEAREAAARYEIGVLVGRPPAAVAAELGPNGELPDLPAPPSLADPESLIRQRPDVAAAERELAAERALVGVAKADYLPRFTLEASAGFTATTAGSLGEEGTSRYGVGPVISWAAFDLGRVKARVDASRARELESEARYAESVLRALEEMETSLARYQAARARVQRIQEAASASERAAELARLRFSEGVADFLQVLDAERTQLETQDQLARARTEAATIYAELYKALGGAWPTSGG